jgi:hypothetical protein
MTVTVPKWVLALVSLVLVAVASAGLTLLLVGGEDKPGADEAQETAEAMLSEAAEGDGDSACAFFSAEGLDQWNELQEPIPGVTSPAQDCPESITGTLLGEHEDIEVVDLTVSDDGQESAARVNKEGIIEGPIVLELAADESEWEVTQLGPFSSRAADEALSDIED